MRPRFALLALATTLAAAPAAARDVFTDLLSGYTIAADVLNAPNCQGPAFDDTTLVEFEQGLCTLHRPARSPADTERAIELFDIAQTRGLPPVHQALASLGTGLAQCAQADRHLQTYRASDNQDLMARTLFCRDRRFAAAELNSVRWDQALFDYAEGLGPTRTLDARLGEMSACHAGALDPAFDAECGLISNISETEIAVFVDEAADQVIEKYFAGVESPITAMFARKLERAEGLKDSAAEGIADLQAGAETINAAYSALNDAYEGARDSRMAPIYSSYRDAILRATSILDEFDRWKGGLFITSENINLLPKIAERAVEIEEELTRARDLAFEAKTASLLSDIRRIVGGEAESRATITELCRIYFCELTSRRSMAAAVRACRRPSLAGNPICVDQDGGLRGGALTVDFEGAQSIEVGELCRAAGLDPAFTVVGLAPATAATCLEAMP